jgi:hypothetical protein
MLLIDMLLKSRKNLSTRTNGSLVEPRFKNTGRRQIIDEDSTATVVTATIQPKELADLEEGERLFHS